VDAKKYKYKEIVQKRITIMEHVFVYGYMSIGLVGASIIGMIVFVWIILRKLQRVPHR
jgi:hypothetical protein